MCWFFFFFFQAEDGIRDRSPSRGLGDVYKRQAYVWNATKQPLPPSFPSGATPDTPQLRRAAWTATVPTSQIQTPLNTTRKRLRSSSRPWIAPAATKRRGSSFQIAITPKPPNSLALWTTTLG